ncbi:polysaccharide deacetylase family protein [Herbaspirillum autotrophicum]|uniref:polysaccharide deacetylase family protein n=1 Tax=Herbaspirillum autotrophicum TaxID=180195 RepID=UPI00067D43C2|nr:polysaccharide deacetylase family protein [Herbaspirillum autotrophicum]
MHSSSPNRISTLHSLQRRHSRSLLGLLALSAALLLTACNTIPASYTPLSEQQQRVTAPIRFILSFDDGPSASEYANPTESILRDLDNNPVQPGIKAVFFVQTRATNGGRTPLGQQLMQQEASHGHLLGLHNASPGHSDQVHMAPAQLEQMLQDGIADVTRFTGHAPVLLRPPFWHYDARTFEAYQRHGLHIILTDLSANDGKIYGVNFSLRRRSNMLRMLAEVRQQISRHELPAIDGSIPVIVTFHDTNRYTARHMQEYLQILLDSASELQLKVATLPFYNDKAELQRALLARAIRSEQQLAHFPGIWNMLWPSTPKQ